MKDHHSLVVLCPIADATVRTFCFLRGIHAKRTEWVRSQRVVYSFDFAGEAEELRDVILACANDSAKEVLASVILFTDARE